jgi:SAM-dependent methyltransferase
VRSTFDDAGGGARSIEQIRRHYEVEKLLAQRLRSATKEERKRLYATVYAELYERVPDHPQLRRALDAEAQARSTWLQLQFLDRFLRPDTTFLELGPGDCHLSFTVASRVKKVYAVDVCFDAALTATRPPNVELVPSDGSSVDVPAKSVDVAYSNQLMEHLHPADAAEHARNIHRALVQGGTYICITPHRFMGPCDISRHFDKVATGLHLKEYTHWELRELFRRAGFSRTDSWPGARGRYVAIPAWVVGTCEQLLRPLPYGLRRRLSRSLGVRQILWIRMVATK